MNNDKPLVNLYLPGEIVQPEVLHMGSNDEAVSLSVTAPTWGSLQAKIMTPAGAYVLTLTESGAELTRSDN